MPIHPMPIHPLAGQPIPEDMLPDISALMEAYSSIVPDPESPDQRVQFGTSGHRGTSTDGSFNEGHILAITQAVCRVRAEMDTTGPLFVGFDTHALSEGAFRTVMEVAAANGAQVRFQDGFSPTPTPVVSNRILVHNRMHPDAPADGIIITPSHNPPQDGGIKYNPPSGGPADTDVTARIEREANKHLSEACRNVQRIPFERASRAECVQAIDFVGPYVDGLGRVLDLGAVSKAGIRMGADPLGGSGAAYWDVIAERYNLDITVVNPVTDPAFSFMRLDRDGKIRMDCSSPWAMAGLVELKDRFDLAFGNDPDFDRHGIVTPHGGLMNPNHYLAVAIEYLFSHRAAWPTDAGVGKTLVSGSMIDRVAAELGRPLMEVPVGFKWFVDGLFSGTLGFGGEESAGASFLTKDGTAWSTDKDGFIMNLLAAEIMAVTGEDPAARYEGLTVRFGAPVYARTDAPASREQKRILKALDATDVRADKLGGDPITNILTKAPGNGAPIGGLKVTSGDGWFAARPSGTEDIYKIYAESFRGGEHLEAIQDEARLLIDGVFERAGV